MSKPTLREFEWQAARARQAMQEATEAFAERLGEISDDTRLTGAGKLDAARALATERRDELARLGQAEAEALAAYAAAAETAAMARPSDQRSPMASKPTRRGFLHKSGEVNQAAHDVALKRWREGLAEATYTETVTRTALETLRDLPPEVLAAKFELALAEGDVGTARAVQSLALRRMAGPVPEGMEGDVQITPETWGAHALIEREMGPSAKAVPHADPDGWALIQRIAKAEEATMTDTQLEARAKVSTGSHRVPPTSVDQALAGAGIAGEVRTATEEGLEGGEGGEG